MITPVVERWKKTTGKNLKKLLAAPALLILLHVLWLIIRLLRSRWCEIIAKDTGVWQYFHNNIYVSESIFVKLANDLNQSIYQLAVYLQLLWGKTFSYRAHAIFKRPSIKLISWVNFVVSHIVFTFILKLLCLFF